MSTSSTSDRDVFCAAGLLLIRLHSERGSPKYEKAALRWLERYLSEGSPSLRDVAKVTASLAEPELEVGGLNYGQAGRLPLSSLSFAPPCHDDMPARIHDGRCNDPFSAAPP